MSRIPLADIDDLTSDQRAQYDRFPSNLSRALLLAEPRLAGVPPSMANALRASGLDPKIREAVILRVAALSDSAYERMQHLDQARKAGWSHDEIAAIEKGETSGLDPETARALGFAGALVALPRVPDAVFEAARAVFGPSDLIALILLVGHYMTIARLLLTLDVELDPAPDAWDQEH